MVEIRIDYEGDLHTHCVHGPSGNEIATDAPTDNNGRGESFSPTDLLATALGTCMLTVMGIAAQKNGWAFAAASARVEKHMVADPVRRVGRLRLEFALPSGLDADARKRLEEAALGCPVKQSIHPEIDIETVFDWAGST